MSEKKRIVYLDYAKGLTIILMVLAHCMAVDNPIKTWIASFFMPIFFIINGFLQYSRYDKDIIFEDIIALFKKRLVQLGIPYVVFSLLISFYYVLNQFISGNKVEIRRYLIRIITLRGVESMWFIPCIFVAEMILILIFYLGKKAELVASFFSVLVIVYITIFSHRMPTNDYIRLLIVWAVGFLFEYIGMNIARLKIIERTTLITTMMLFISGVILAEINGQIGMAALVFNCGILAVLNATITSIAILSFFKFVEKKDNYGLNFFEFTGRDTIVILCTNNLLIEIFRLLDYKITGNFMLNHGILGAFLFSVIILLCESLIIILSHTCLKFLFGKGIAIREK